MRAFCKLLVLLLALVILAPAGARADVYDVPILVNDAEDLRDLLENGDIDDDLYDILMHLMERPLDLNRASRRSLYDLPGVTYAMVDAIVRYRTQTKFTDPDDLEMAGIPDDVIRQVAPFVRISKRYQREPLVQGHLNVKGMEAFDDGRTPAFQLRPRLRWRGGIDTGLALLVQDAPGAFSYHHADGLTWLSADATAPRVQVPKLYVMMDRPDWGFIVGSYQIGFAEGLVFDETSRAEPDGFYPDDLLSEYAESGEFGVRERLYGAAVTFRGIPLGDTAGTLDVSAFVSYWPYELSQNDVDSKLRPQDDSVYDAGADPLYCESGVDPYVCGTEEGTGRFTSDTLRWAFTELIFGGRVAYSPVPDWIIGVTGYGALFDWVETDDLVFTPSSRYPNRDTVGGYGLDLQGHLDIFTLRGEYARTVHGGDAAVLRLILAWPVLDLELSGRYYSQDFDNPHARGFAAADEFEGQRDRDEAGGNLRLTVRPLDWLNARVDLDVWYRPSLDYASLTLKSRFDIEPIDIVTFSFGVDYADKDLSEGGRDEEYSDDTSTDEEGEIDRDVGAGARVSAWAQLRVRVHPRVQMIAFYKSTLWDAEVTEKAYAYEEPVRLLLASFYDENFAHDHYAYLLVRARVIDPLWISGRVKYYDAETEFSYRGESYVEGWLQLRWKIIAALSVQARYQLRYYVDERDTVRADWGPAVNPEHMLKASLDWRF